MDYYNLVFFFIGFICSFKFEFCIGFFYLFFMFLLVGGLVDVMFYKEWEGIYYIYDFDEGK